MRDFTEGSVIKQLVHFSIPMLLTNLLQAMYEIVDAMWVGKLIGHKAFAAVSVTMPIFFLLLSAMIGLTIATTILAGQAFGSKNMRLLSKVLTNSFLGTGLICVVISAIGIIFSENLLTLVNTPPEIRKDAHTFFVIMVAGIVPMFGYNWFSGVLRGLGDAKTPLYLLIVSSLINITLVPVLIKGVGPFPALGITGAALGTIISSIIMLFVAYFFVLRKHPLLNIRKWDFALDKEIWRKIFVIGIPVSLQMIVVSLSGTLIMSLVNTFGVQMTAAYGIGMQLDQLAFMPAMAIGMSVSSMVAQNLGAKRYDRVREITKLSILLSLAMSLVFFIIFYTFPTQVASFFTKESSVLVLTKEYIRIVSFTYFIFSIMFALQGVVRGAGDTMYMLIFGLIGFVGVRYPLAYALTKFTTMREYGIWVAILISTFVGLVLNYWYYRSGRWRTKVIVTHSPMPETTLISGKD
ncbi:MAG: MATE family efflux transporter [bacterium]|nr:MATE family efflux transporter [bacterium]